MDSRLEERLMALAFVLIFAVMIGTAIWWLPQKWTACKKLYDNKPAQVFCFLSKS